MKLAGLPRVRATAKALTLLAFAGLLLLSGCSSSTEGLSAAKPLTDSDSGLESNAVTEARFSYKLIPGKLAEENAVPQDPVPIRLLGRGTTSRIVDRDGNVVRDGRTGNSISNLLLSPNRTLALIYFGDATYTVASVDTLDDIASLPQYPPVDDDVTGFRWFFLDDAHLLGAAQLRSTDIEGRMASEIDSLPPRATLLYVYSLGNETMTPVEIDTTLPKIFSIHDVSGWSMSLLTLGEDERRLEARIERTPGT